MVINPDFDIYLSLGIIVKGRTDELKKLIEYIEEDTDLTLVFTKTSGGKLKIIDSSSEEKL